MLKRLGQVWTAVALFTFNVLIFLLTANLAAQILVVALDNSHRPRFSSELLLQAYPDRTLTEIRHLQNETWGRDYEYEPFTQFKEGSVEGDFVRVSSAGFRISPSPAPWPPNPENLNVFVFGGSTAFGYGISDSETIPFQLESHLRSGGCQGVRVYNLARSNYFSTQERILFEKLLLEGIRPHVAVFIDGLNDFVFADGEPKFTRRLDYLMNESKGKLVFRALKQMPLVRLARLVVGPVDDQAPEEEPAEIDAQARAVLQRWSTNAEMIQTLAQSSGIETLFVWQPVPLGLTDRVKNPFVSKVGRPITNYSLLKRGYELKAAEEPGGDFRWLADLDIPGSDPLWVDRVHYSPQFSTAIAREIASVLAPDLCSVVADTHHTLTDEN